jgi:hypothetical protein
MTQGSSLVCLCPAGCLDPGHRRRSSSRAIPSRRPSTKKTIADFTRVVEQTGIFAGSAAFAETAQHGGYDDPNCAERYRNLK